MSFNHTPNGWRYLRVGGRGLNSLYGKMLKCRTMPFFWGVNPTRQVHALLACAHFTRQEFFVQHIQSKQSDSR